MRVNFYTKEEMIMSKRGQLFEPTNDEKIIDMYWERNPDAIQETDHKYGKVLRSVAYNILFDDLDCEECQNDAYLGIWNAIPSARPTVFSAFIMRIMRWTAISRYKEKSRKKRIPSQLTISLEDLADSISSDMQVEEECEAKTAAYNQYVEDNTRNGFAPTQQYLTDIAVARRSVNDAYHNLITAQNVHNEHKNAVGITREIEGSIEKADELGGEASILARAAEFFSKQIKSLAIAAGGALIILAALIFEIIGAVKKLPAVATISVGLVGFVVLVASAIFAFIFFKNKKLMANLAAEFSTENYQDLKLKIQLVSEARAKRDGMIAATESARVNVENSKAAYERSKRELTSVILRWGEEPPKTELNKFLDELKAKVTKYLDGKNALYEEKNEIEITVREIRRTLADKSEVDIRAQVSPLKRKALSGINHDEIINGIADFKAEIAEQDRIAFNIENELFTLKARAGDPADLYAKIAAIDKRLEELRLAHKAYFIALSAIENASDNLRAEISPRLAEYSTDLMGIMTNKKYTSFDVSEGLKVTFKDADGEERSVDFLSGGTRDLTYIAVRMALIDMLYDDKPPIVFDESFAHQDNLRARSMMAGLSKLSEDGIQSFVFTCRAREGALAKEIVADCGVYKLSVVDEEFA